MGLVPGSNLKPVSCLMKPWEVKRVAEAWDHWGNVNREPCFECLQDKILESLILKVYQTQILCKQNSFCRTGIVVVLKESGHKHHRAFYREPERGETGMEGRCPCCGGQRNRSFAPSFWHLANSQPRQALTVETNHQFEAPDKDAVSVWLSFS